MFPSESASLMAQVVNNLPALQEHSRHGLDPWFGKIPWRRAWQPTAVFLLENPMDRGAWRASVCMVAKSCTRLSMHDH